ncbi:MAG: protein translocase subunit SecD [Candidatus Yanofskybacteria bacterium]|nr:protein translocase subunit SecD [Candidatus Yanofskybacteria bacterium]
MHRNTYTLIGIVLGTLLLGIFVAPQYVNRGVDFFNAKTGLKAPHAPTVPFRLGLDLLGGTHLVYQADLSQLNDQDPDEAMAGIRDVIERRVNFFGVSEPTIQVSGANQLIVDLAGIQDVNQAIELIGETPFLEFREEKADTQAIIEAQQRGERLNEDPFAPSGLNGRHVRRAQVVFDQQTFRPQVSLNLTDEGAKIFAEVTRRNIGKLLAIYLDGAPISIPVVQSEISNGEAVISGNFTPNEAKLLATRLNSGALPVPIKLISQQTIGASLGAESLSKSLRAGLFGLLFVALFMVLFYRLPGVVSVFALLIYVTIVLAIYKFIPVTLTLAGIAGFILSLGMAVDANVLIFARLREELKAGRTLTQSVQEGFRRAWLSIRDSHVTTLISAVILYIFTTSIVKGFALTLGIGAVVSLLTAIIVTRTFLNLFTGSKFEARRWLFG